MLESYIMTGDGKEYVDVDNVREALGIKEDENIFRAIKKLREERDELKDNLRITENALKTVKKERDELKDKCDKLKTRANAAYGDSCGYSGNKTPAFLCDVISYSWELGPIEPHSLMDEPSYRAPNDSIHVELELTPTANYKGTFDLEDLKHYIQAYGREKKLGIIESVDYQNAKAARAELAFLYKQVLGKEKLDTNLSPHEVMKAILDAVKKLRDAQFASDQCLRSVYMHIYEGTGYDISDIYVAPDKIAEWIITRYDSTKTLYRSMADSNFNKAVEFRKEKQAAEDSRREFVRELSCSLGFGDPVVTRDSIDQKEKDILERIEGLKAGVWPCENSSTFAEYLKKEFPELCKEYNVAPLTEGGSVRDWIKYIFSTLTDYRNMADSNFKKAVDFRKEKRAVENVLAELRAKIREIYRSVVDDEWDEYLAYTSALNDINEEYKRVVHNFEERTADWSKAQQELDRYKLAVGSLLGIPKETRDDINAIERSFEFSKKMYESLKEFLDAVKKRIGVDADCSDNKYMLRCLDIKLDHSSLSNFVDSVYEELGLNRYGCTLTDTIDELKKTLRHDARFRSNICTALCLGGETSDEDILKRVRMTKECHDKLCKDYTKLHDDYVASQKQVKGFTNRCDSLENLRQDLWEFRRNAIEDLKTRGFFFRPEENETLPEIYDKLLKRYDDYFSRYKEQYRLRQCWHARYESEHERANGVQKALDREREKCRVKDISLETAKKQYEKVCSNLETAECAINGMKSKVRSLQEEKTKVITALGQDIWDDAVK